MTDNKHLQVELADGVLTITLDRPKANAFNDDMIDEFMDALKRAERSDEVRCVLLTGAGKLFSAGQDVGAFGGDDVSFRDHLERTYNRLILKMRSLEKPIVAAINGPAAGAALGIALAADLRVAGESAKFVFGFTGIGLTTDSGTSLTLPLLIGLTRASEMAFTNRPLPAQEALTAGLVNRVVDDGELMEAAKSLANELAQGPTAAFGLTKRAFNKAHLGNLQETLDYEAYLQDIAGGTQDHHEGLAAFAEKREPDFKGK